MTDKEFVLSIYPTAKCMKNWLTGNNITYRVWLTPYKFPTWRDDYASQIRSDKNEEAAWKHARVYVNFEIIRRLEK